MNEKQKDLLELIELLLPQVSEDRVYRHLKTKIDGRKIFIEDTVTSVYFTIGKIPVKTTMPPRPQRGARRNHIVVIDMERTSNGPRIISWNEEASDEMMNVLQNYYILEMLAGI